MDGYENARIFAEMAAKEFDVPVALHLDHAETFEEVMKAFYSGIADYLLDNGVIVLPCAVGDTVYRTNEEAIEPYPYVVFSEPFACFVKNLWGKEFFATKEEAEAKLKELER